MAKYRLEEKPLRPHVVLGISCHVPDYRLCWSVNKGLGLELTRRREAITELVRGKELHYTVFEVKGRDGEARFALICNCGVRPSVSNSTCAAPGVASNTPLTCSASFSSTS